MKQELTLGLPLLVIVFGLISPSPASAICVDTDANFQIAITSPNTLPIQNNTVERDIVPGCFGNSSTTIGSQVYVGPGSVEQERTVYKYQATPNSPLPGLGVSFPPIVNDVDIKVQLPILP